MYLKSIKPFLLVWQCKISGILKIKTVLKSGTAGVSLNFILTMRYCSGGVCLLKQWRETSKLSNNLLWADHV
ncbi:hypothetical protein PRUB_a3820 [Pseudoalteromonas rubra]|uniref:Uncharacterized protein n=1 Tax=Pseudoalteromonas rubra TaxID=43658 RepID=A0A8T0C882_9GAMM|nr:hypothetical protein PRUB_a3820 [Pseudoalteromonas rubra]